MAEMYNVSIGEWKCAAVFGMATTICASAAATTCSPQQSLLSNASCTNHRTGRHYFPHLQRVCQQQPRGCRAAALLLQGDEGGQQRAQRPQALQPHTQPPVGSKRGGQEGPDWGAVPTDDSGVTQQTRMKLVSYRVW